MIAPGAARTVQGGVNFRDLGSAANLLRKGAVYRCSQIFRSLSEKFGAGEHLLDSLWAKNAGADELCGLAALRSCSDFT